MAIWHAGNTISNIISGFLAAGILTTMGGVAGLYSWQWFFLIEGIATFTIALSAYVLLPDWPHNTRFLSPEEKEIAQYRILCSNGGVQEVAGGTWDGLKDAVKDPFTWIFCLLHFALVTAQSFKDFFPSVSISIFEFLEDEFVVADLWLDCEDFRLWRAHNVFHPGTSIRFRLRIFICCCLVVRSEPGVLLAHSAAYNCQCRRLLRSNFDHEYRSSLLWSFSAHFRDVQRLEPATFVGDNSRARPSE